MLTSNGWSPADKLYGQQIRNFVWASSSTELIHATQEKMKKQIKVKSTNSKRPEVFQINQKVWISSMSQPKKWLHGTIIQKSIHPRSYIVQTADKTIMKRNEQHLRPRRERENKPEDYYQEEETTKGMAKTAGAKDE